MAVLLRSYSSLKPCFRITVIKSSKSWRYKKHDSIIDYHIKPFSMLMELFNLMWNASLTPNLSSIVFVFVVQLKYKTQQNHISNKDHYTTTADNQFVSFNLNDQIPNLSMIWLDQSIKSSILNGMLLDDCWVINTAKTKHINIIGWNIVKKFIK